MEAITTMNTTPETEPKVETKAPQTAEEWKADASRKLLALRVHGHCRSIMCCAV